MANKHTNFDYNRGTYVPTRKRKITGINLPVVIGLVLMLVSAGLVIWGAAFLLELVLASIK